MLKLLRNFFSEDTSQATYQDMPSLMSAHRSPNAKQVPSPSIYFHYPTPPRRGSEVEQQVCPPTQVIQSPHCQPQLEANRKQKIVEMRIFDQQFAILNDIMAKNNNNQCQGPPLQQQPPVSQNPPFSAAEPTPQFQQIPQALQVAQCPASHSPKSSNFNASPTSQPPPLLSPSAAKKQAPSTSPITSIDIRIPSPKQINYVPNTTDVIISTPQVSNTDIEYKNPFLQLFFPELAFDFQVVQYYYNLFHVHGLDRF